MCEVYHEDGVTVSISTMSIVIACMYKLQTMLNNNIHVSSEEIDTLGKWYTLLSGNL